MTAGKEKENGTQNKKIMSAMNAGVLMNNFPPNAEATASHAGSEHGSK